ncbi:MAG TPA: universal stress protein [Syntrophales bacterium]|nr:universal stress protein [Syntrophales bacterium]
MFEPKNILVPTDFSPYADKALQTAVDIAKNYNAKIYLLHVISEVLYECGVDYCLSNAELLEIEQVSMRTSTDKLQEEVKRIKASSGGLYIIFDIKRGHPYETILTEQEDKKIDLIVIASHGRTGLLKHLIGSVAEKVLRGAKCNVLLVKS